MTGNEQLIVATNVQEAAAATGTQSLQRYLYKTRIKIQNVKPNKATGSAEDIGSPV